MATTRILSNLLKGGGKLVIFVFVLLIIIEYAYTKYHKYKLKHTPTKVSREVEFNTTNQHRLQGIFSERIDNAIKLLHQKGMTIEEWSELQRNDKVFDVDHMSYYMFIYRKVLVNTNEKTYLCLSIASDEYEGLEFSDIVRSSEQTMMFNKYRVNYNLIANMFNDAQPKDTSYPFIKYYWVDPLTGNAVEKRSTYGTAVSNDGVEVIMGIGYTVKNLASSEETKLYNASIPKYNIIFVQVIIGLIGFIMYLSGRNSDVYNVHKSILFMISMFIYVILFTNIEETANTYELEIEKLEGILRSLMSVAFMSSVSIYINTKLKKVNRSLYIENSVLFAATIMMLLVSSLSSTNYKTISELIQVRVSKQFFFNFAILLNVYIVINFLIHLSSMVKAVYKLK